MVTKSWSVYLHTPIERCSLVLENTHWFCMGLPPHLSIQWTFSTGSSLIHHGTYYVSLFSLVFIRYVQILGMVLKELGFSNCVLHSMTRQQLRLEAMSLFKSHKVRILVATDLASRGLDIPTVDLVINHSVPTRPQDYIHRVGRTARAGRPIN